MVLDGLVLNERIGWRSREELRLLNYKGKREEGFRIRIGMGVAGRAGCCGRNGKKREWRSFDCSRKRPRRCIKGVCTVTLGVIKLKICAVLFRIPVFMITD